MISDRKIVLVFLAHSYMILFMASDQREPDRNLQENEMLIPEFRKIEPMDAAERAAYRAAKPAAASKMDESLRKIRAGLIAEFGEAIAESLMPAALQR